ncbi:MAG TPA: hypothetical protein VGF67_19400 [Ktedonobacteraceae bacterium]
MNMEIHSSPPDQKPKTNLLRWWRKLSLPPDPPPEASFKQRDIVRRASLASILLFWFILVLIVVFCIYGVTNPTSPTLIILVAPLLLLLLATYLNRKGRVNLAGFIISAGITLVIWAIILGNHAGLVPENLGLFDLLVYPELLAASLLPANWVFATALANSTFVVLAFTYAPRSALMAQLLAASGATIIERPIQMQILVSVVLWLWVRNATNAIKRADRAEEISKLQRVVADHMLEKVNQKRQLDLEIQQIELVLDQSAAGRLEARVVPQSGNMLWSISGKLNNLLARFRRIVQEHRQAQQVLSQFERLHLVEQKYQRLTTDLDALARTIQQAEERQRPLQFVQSGTPLDQLLRSINGKYIATSLPNSRTTTPLGRPYTSISLEKKMADEETSEAKFPPDLPRSPQRYQSQSDGVPMGRPFTSASLEKKMADEETGEARFPPDLPRGPQRYHSPSESVLRRDGRRNDHSKNSRDLR